MNFIIFPLKLLILLIISKAFFDTISSKDTPLANCFIFLMIIYYFICVILPLLNISFDIIYLLLIVIITLLLISIIIKRKVSFYNTKYVIISMISSLLLAVFSYYYCDFVSLTTNTVGIQNLKEIINGNGPILYDFLYDLLPNNLFIAMEIIPVFVNCCIFIFFFLLLDLILVNTKGTRTDLLSLSSFLVFFIGYPCLKFSYLNYLWIVFPVNIAFTYINRKNIQLSESVFLGSSLFSILLFTKDNYIALIILFLLLIIIEFSGIIKDYKYKLILVTLLVMFLLINQNHINYLIYLLLILFIMILIQKIKFKNIFYYMTIIIFCYLGINYYINNDADLIYYFSKYIFSTNNICIEFLNFQSLKLYILLAYVLMIILCLIHFKKCKFILKEIFLTTLIVFNPYIINIFINGSENVSILLFLLFNSTFIKTLFNMAYKLLKKYKYDNNLLVASFILILYCISSALYPNIFVNYTYYTLEQNPYYRISQVEAEIYKYIYDNNIDFKGNIVSQAPNTEAFFTNITLLDTYSYYSQLSLEETIDSPSNLTNIFSIRPYNDVNNYYYKQERDFDKSIDELKDNDYRYLILDKSQYIQTKFFDSLPLYLFYSGNGYEILIENDLYVLLRLKPSLES